MFKMHQAGLYVCAICILAISTMFCRIASAEDYAIDLNQLIDDTQYSDSDADKMSLIWWIPIDFWEVAFAQDKRASKEEIDEYLGLLRPYLIVAVVDGDIGSFGAVKYKSDRVIRENLRIKDSSGTLYTPYDEEDIDPDVLNFMAMIRPIITNIAGPLGENMHFLVFPSEGDDGMSLVNIREHGEFIIEYAGNEKRWRTPLGSAVSPKICPVCGEKLNGAYRYCPWDGTKLPE